MNIVAPAREAVIKLHAGAGTIVIPAQAAIDCTKHGQFRAGTIGETAASFPLFPP